MFELEETVLPECDGIGLRTGGRSRYVVKILAHGCYPIVPLMYNVVIEHDAER